MLNVYLQAEKPCQIQGIKTLNSKDEDLVIWLKEKFFALVQNSFAQKVWFFSLQGSLLPIFLQKIPPDSVLDSSSAGFHCELPHGEMSPRTHPFFQNPAPYTHPTLLANYYSLHVSECMLLSDCCCKHLSVAGYPWRDCCCWGVAAVAWIWQYKCLTWLVWGMIIDWKIITAFSQYWYSTQLQQTFS